jgi:hypothetical protein
MSVDRMKEEVARFKASGEAPGNVFVQSAESYARERAFVAQHPDVPMRRRTEIGMNDKGQQTMWLQLFNDDTGELMYTDNDAYMCPPWPEHYCNPG